MVSAGRSSGPLDPWALPTATCAASPAQGRRYVPPSNASPTAPAPQCHSQSATRRDGTAQANTRRPLPADESHLGRPALPLSLGSAAKSTITAGFGETQELAGRLPPLLLLWGAAALAPVTGALEKHDQRHG